MMLGSLLTLSISLSDDVIYGLALILSVAIGPLFRYYIKGETQTKWISTAIGIILLCTVCGVHYLHLIITVIGNCLLITLFPPAKKHVLPALGFAWNFGYLVLFRTVHWFGVPAPSPVTNAAQLFLTLRMTGLAFELQDCYDRKAKTKESGDCAENETKRLVLQYTKIAVSPLDVICYANCYIGLLTGPYFKYRTYMDWLKMHEREKLCFQDVLNPKLMKLPLIALCFVFFSYFFNIKYVETEAFSEQSFIFRLFYMVPMFTIFRTRLYIAWIMSECMCITAGLGAYPLASKPRCGSGPTEYNELDKISEKEKKDPDYHAPRDFETVHNIDIYGCELAPRTKQGLRSWNMTVQYWLAHYVHQRVPPSLKAYRVAITMTVSAFWHGIHPGYYLSFLTVPPILMAEEAMIKGFRDGASEHGQSIFDWGCWFLKMRGFDYNCMGFLLLRLNSTWNYWKSIYFTGHFVTLLFFILGNVGIAMRPKEKKKA